MLALRHMFSGIQWLISATVRMYADHLNLCFNKMVTSIYINEYVCTLFELTPQPNKCENRFMETNRCTYWFCIAWIVIVNWEMNYFMWKINLTWEIEKKKLRVWIIKFCFRSVLQSSVDFLSCKSIWYGLCECLCSYILHLLSIYLAAGKYILKQNELAWAC